jgi:hypothetical protein
VQSTHRDRAEAVPEEAQDYQQVLEDSDEIPDF